MVFQLCSSRLQCKQRAGRPGLMWCIGVQVCAEASTSSLEQALTESQQGPLLMEMPMRKKDGSRSVPATTD